MTTPGMIEEGMIEEGMIEEGMIEEGMIEEGMIEEGELLPDLPLVDHEGTPWRFANHRGRPLLLILHRHLA